MNLIALSLLMRASMASLFLRSIWTYSCQPKIWSGEASLTICSGVMDALLEIICNAPKLRHASAMPASPDGWPRRAIAAGEM